MADPIIITADDKRIRDLLQQDALNASDFIAVDRPGWLTARRFTVQDIISLFAPILPKQIATSGIVNPDNAAGATGDFYFKTGGAQLSLYQKNGATWALIFAIPISANKEVISGDQTSVESIGGQGRKIVSSITDESIWRAQYTVGADTYQLDQTMLQNGAIYGFPDPAESNFTYKIIFI